MADDNSYIDDSKLKVILISVGSAALVVTVYHCIAVGWCNRHQRRPSPPQPGHSLPDSVDMRISMENSAAQLIPAHKYQKGMGLVGDDCMCAVCLCEFEEGEELRTLPECLHSYHAPCIDMWLYSHSNCPMCRTDATPSPQIFPRPDSSTESLESGMLQNVVVQSRTM
ncbi:RING-H2 finger protein ATL52-like [Melia azedarach]|uniref:RING-H2 finger protein ATL52-like n=1 Tax=Melia azedarach TaxID=155640 RepID=A0ACC1Y8F8_MELAZ|nr:RING-H2 finger protein ATL52-like [Melia azedarach]